ncbi:unnamed protein product [Symbiodinium microadriaticum]|nr:unnamed protein product [Symbiodinium sp. KB8]CAE7490876.1 unnamed protein product [Symbiodinium microadriaticum]
MSGMLCLLNAATVAKKLGKRCREHKLEMLEAVKFCALNLKPAAPSLGEREVEDEHNCDFLMGFLALFAHELPTAGEMQVALCIASQKYSLNPGLKGFAQHCENNMLSMGGKRKKSTRLGEKNKVPPDEEETQVTADPRSPSTPGSSVKPDFGFHSLESPQSCMHGEGEEGNEEENLTDDECVDPAPDGCEPEGLAECLQEFEESEVQDQEQELKDEKQETEDEEQDDSGSAGEMLGDDKRRSKAEQESSGTLKDRKPLTDMPEVSETLEAQAAQSLRRLKAVEPEEAKDEDGQEGSKEPSKGPGAGQGKKKLKRKKTKRSLSKAFKEAQESKEVEEIKQCEKAEKDEEKEDGVKEDPGKSKRAAADEPKHKPLPKKKKTSEPPAAAAAAAASRPSETPKETQDPTTLLLQKLADMDPEFKFQANAKLPEQSFYVNPGSTVAKEMMERVNSKLLTSYKDNSKGGVNVAWRLSGGVVNALVPECRCCSAACVLTRK